MLVVILAINPKTSARDIPSIKIMLFRAEEDFLSYSDSVGS